MGEAYWYRNKNYVVKTSDLHINFEINENEKFYILLSQLSERWFYVILSRPLRITKRKCTRAYAT